MGSRWSKNQERQKKIAKNLPKNFGLDFAKSKKIGFSVQVLWPKRIYKAQPLCI